MDVGSRVANPTSPHRRMSMILRILVCRTVLDVIGRRRAFKDLHRKAWYVCCPVDKVHRPMPEVLDSHSNIEARHVTETFAERLDLLLSLAFRRPYWAATVRQKHADMIVFASHGPLETVRGPQD